ncbi:SipW-dependent-type signal peptide-containing protein [Nocardioides dubius]|uniref:SipW-dependent-type signal peptide-containing protein n=1 Tax=Nocardioides dubius TaxID=317019 RepID=UPI0031E19664
MVLALGLVACLGAVATSAFWTDQVTVAGTGFSAGTLDLEVNDDPDDAVALTTLSLSNMVPGNSAAGVLKVENTGTVPLAYNASTAATNPDAKNLAGALTVKVTGSASVTGAAPTATCAGTALAGTGTSLAAPLVSTKRVLAPGASETLCVQVTLPTAAGNALQGSATVATFTFDATSELP